MKLLLTNRCKYLNEIDPLLASIYGDRHSYISFSEISEYRHLPKSKVEQLYKEAKYYIKHPDKVWLRGLQGTRAKHALATSAYTDFTTLYLDVMNENVDLECFKGVGHKVALEIRRWCITKKPVKL